MFNNNSKINKLKETFKFEIKITLHKKTTINNNVQEDQSILYQIKINYKLDK